ncbi:MAG: aminoacyl-tRNA hydrolase [Robiginitomaculum sp.]|nr:aminoacyl-tRNA hydrolase [Robiginitomaculum sp.]
MAGIRLIVGLANPGKQYANTRHNVGAWFLHELARQHQAALSAESKFHGMAATCSIDSVQCRLLEPTTFMNESGRAVRAMVQFYKLMPEQVLVIHDELDFDPGVIRLKKGGGHGGHNGLRDVAAHLTTPDYYRLRIGIGHPGDRHKVTPYVLGEPSKSDKDKIQRAIDEGLRVMDDLVAGEFEKAMHWLHSE